MDAVQNRIFGWDDWRESWRWLSSSKKWLTIIDGGRDNDDSWNWCYTGWLLRQWEWNDKMKTSTTNGWIERTWLWWFPTIVKKHKMKTLDGNTCRSTSKHHTLELWDDFWRKRLEEKTTMAVKREEQQEDIHWQLCFLAAMVRMMDRWWRPRRMHRKERFASLEWMP